MAARQRCVRRWLFITAVFSGAIAPVSAAAAAGSRDEQVTVQETPYTVRQQDIGHTIGNMSAMEVRQTSVSKAVTYSDLDLSKDADVAILKERARKAASDVCHEADRQAESPFYRRLNAVPDCFASADQQALANVNRIVADARAGRTFAAR